MTTLLSAVRYAGRRGKEGLLFLRGKRILQRYTTHYRRAQRIYARDHGVAIGGGPPAADVGVLVIRPEANDTALPLAGSHDQCVARVAESVRKAFEQTARCRFFPPVDGPLPDRTADVPALINREAIAIQLLDPFGLDGLHELCEPIVREIERRIYGAYAIVDKVYVYRNPICDQAPRTSWRWHYDNHPREMLKVMVYLTDVAEGTAPFQYVRERSSGRPWPGKPLTPLFGLSRIPPEEVDRRAADGWEVTSITGRRGTVIVFDDNVVHRATLGQNGHRDVVVFQVRPAAFAASPHIDRRWTGTFGYRAMNGDPNDLVQYRVW